MLQISALPLVESNAAEETARDILDQRIRKRLAQCSYRFFLNQVNWHVDAGHLKLLGRVHSFHMKQILQTLLRDVEGVKQIDNRVEVVNSEGVSSERST